MNDIFRYELYHDGIVQDYKNTLIVIIIRLIQNKLISHVNNNVNNAICYLGMYLVK